VRVNGAGGLQPLSVRQVTMPRPCAPPKTKPPFNREGTTAMHLADPRISSGMPLSGADMISLRTVAADSARWAALSANDTTEQHNNATKNEIRRGVFMGSSQTILM